jgi:hypothetical protein
MGLLFVASVYSQAVSLQQGTDNIFWSKSVEYNGINYNRLPADIKSSLTGLVSELAHVIMRFLSVLANTTAICGPFMCIPMPGSGREKEQQSLVTVPVC